ncbi:MAG: hypothetical protein ABJA80_00280 [bacterium]
MFELAEVVGIEEHLTVPSRNHSKLHDLWIAVSWESGWTEWAAEFADVATRHNNLRSSTGMLQLFPTSERNGWIVARGVNLRAVARVDVEALVRGVVAQVNARMSAMPHTSSRDTAERSAWTVRVRDAVLFGGSALLGFARESTRPTERDAASSR